MLSLIKDTWLLEMHSYLSQNRHVYFVHIACKSIIGNNVYS